MKDVFGARLGVVRSTALFSVALLSAVAVAFSSDSTTSASTKASAASASSGTVPAHGVQGSQRRP